MGEIIENDEKVLYIRTPPTTPLGLGGVILAAPFWTDLTREEPIMLIKNDQSITEFSTMSTVLCMYIYICIEYQTQAL